jgi:hypothetical protein
MGNFQLLALILIAGLCSSCVSSSLPTIEETSLIKEGQVSIALIRITATLHDGTPVKTLDGPLAVDRWGFGVGGFETGGKPLDDSGQRFLSDESRIQGWSFVLLEPGVHYLAFRGPQTGNSWTWAKQLQNARRWVVETSKTTHIYYIGTMHLICESKWYIGGDKRCDYIDEHQMAVRNEKELALEVANNYLKEFGPPQIVLMKPQGSDPIILRTPVSE